MGRRRKKKKNQDQQHRAPRKPLTDRVKKQIEEWSAEAADAHGVVLFDVDISPQWLIQVFVDRPDAEPGDGITVAECASVSRYLEGYLDVEDSVWEEYTLEVSSPGIERKLSKPRHFELSIGREVRIVVHRPIEKRNVFMGELVAFDTELASVECEDGEVVPIEWDNIAKARLIYDFSE